jgi:serine/threonine protein kinase
MSAPSQPLLDLAPEDPGAPVPEAEERSMSHTRRLGSNARAALELAIESPVTDPGEPEPRDPDQQGVDQEPESIRADEIEIISDEKTSGGTPIKRLSRPYIAGDVIAGKYRLTRIIGRGGMGAVWQAHNIPLDIDVAIKVIRRDRTAPEAAERLLTEARAAARLMHPAIVRVFDFGESEQGDPFIVMEMLRGESLSGILRRKRRLTPQVAVQALLPVASALVSAHGKGIVHRDLKPDNIIVVHGEDGALVPKIVDFGIAKLLSAAAPSRQVTMAGEVLGSPDYMSPEQAKGAENVGEATDIWAFSVLLYELVTGKRPFDGPNYNSLIAAILTIDPLPITAHGVGDAALAGIIEHGLAKEIGARWPRMRDYGAALAAWAVANGIEDDMSGTPVARQWLGGAARRLLTVNVEGGGPRTPASPQGLSPAVPGSATAMRTVEPTRVEARARAQRALWWIPVMSVCGLIGTAGFLERDVLARFVGWPVRPAASDELLGLSAAPPAPPASAGDAPAASSPSPEPAPSADAAPSASAAANGSAHPGLKLPSKKLKPLPAPQAPQAPKNIRF